MSIKRKLPEGFSSQPLRQVRDESSDVVPAPAGPSRSNALQARATKPAESGFLLRRSLANRHADLERHREDLAATLARASADHPTIDDVRQFRNVLDEHSDVEPAPAEETCLAPVDADDIAEPGGPAPSRPSPLGLHSPMTADDQG